jgi:hypothetical protein
VYNLSVTALYHYEQILQNIEVFNVILKFAFINLEFVAKDPTAEKTAAI